MLLHGFQRLAAAIFILIITTLITSPFMGGIWNKLTTWNKLEGKREMIGTKTIGKASMTVSVSKHDPATASLEVSIALRNGSDAALFLAQGGQLSALDIEVKTKDGKRVPRTKYGKETLQPLEGPIYGSGDTPEVAPSESFKWKTDLLKCFELPRGTYWVTATVLVWAHDDIRDFCGGEIQSLPVEFEVK